MGAVSLKDNHPAGDTIQDRINWLMQVRLFSEIRGDQAAMEHIAGLMEHRRYSHGSAILKEHDQGSDAYFLTSGTVKVTKHTSGGETFPVAMLDAKDHPFFGEAALLDSDKRSATIACESDCVCLILHKREFDKFCAERPAWALPVVLKIARVVLDRLHKSNNDVVLLYNALVNEVKGWGS